MADTHGDGKRKSEAEKVGEEQLAEMLSYAEDQASLEQLKALTEELREHRNKKKMYHDLEKGEKGLIDEITQTIISIMTTIGINTVTFDGIGKVTIVEEHYASFRREYENRIIETLDKIGHGDMAKRTISAATFKKWFKEESAQREEQGGDPLKDEFGGFVTVFDKTSIRFAKR